MLSSPGLLEPHRHPGRGYQLPQALTEKLQRQEGRWNRATCLCSGHLPLNKYSLHLCLFLKIAACVWSVGLYGMGGGDAVELLWRPLSF